MVYRMYTNYQNDTASFKMMPLVVLFLCLMTYSLKAYPLTRNQRQTVANELATGFTNTGTSFNSWGGQNSQQEEYGFFGSVGGGGYPPMPAKAWDSLGGPAFDRPGSMRGYGNGAKGGGFDGQYDRGYGQQPWRGFGPGKSPFGMRPPQPQYGVKY